MRAHYQQIRSLFLAFFTLLIAASEGVSQELTLEIDRTSVERGVSAPVARDSLTESLVYGNILPGLSRGRILSTTYKEQIPRTRGPADVALFRKVSPSVVLVSAKDSLGTGFLVEDNMVVTNQHVVGRNSKVIVVFKPTDPNTSPTDDDAVYADVIKVDWEKDLALLRPQAIPSRVRSLRIENESSVDIGADVAAIGHPTGEAWTYTKGIISQIRRNYEWKSDQDPKPRNATVIQTQTPINPGNSGGPLLTLGGSVVGINSFRTSGREGLNFAVASSEILKFLKTPQGQLAQIPKSCEKPDVLYEGRNKPETAFLKSLSLDCDGVEDLLFIYPDDKSQPTKVYVYAKGHKLEGIVVTNVQRTLWTDSVWDRDFNETFPLRGIHTSDKIIPDKYVARCPQGTRAAKELKCMRSR